MTCFSFDHRQLQRFYLWCFMAKSCPPTSDMLHSQFTAISKGVVVKDLESPSPACSSHFCIPSQVTFTPRSPCLSYQAEVYTGTAAEDPVLGSGWEGQEARETLKTLSPTLTTQSLFYPLISHQIPQLPQHIHTSAHSMTLFSILLPTNFTVTPAASIPASGK